MDYDTLNTALTQQELFKDKSWRTSPSAWRLPSEVVRSLENIGEACVEFYRALEALYYRSAGNRRILHNKEIRAPWVAEYLDRGKPNSLVEWSRCRANRGHLPRIMRPDLLLTEAGFSLTELDSVPGGLGATAYLNRLYERLGDTSILGKGGSMEMEFYRSMASLAPDRANPVIAILVSEEAGTYKPEMDWLAKQLQLHGYSVYSLWTNEVLCVDGVLFFRSQGSRLVKIDVVYRFFELFDLPNIHIAQFIPTAVERGQLVVTPPLRPFLEEKLGMALFHHHLLEEFWQESLTRKSLDQLKRVIPKSWVVDPAPVPPGAVIDGPIAQGKPLHTWMDLARASQRERKLVLKISGFHETAWGSRGVVVGHDVCRARWAKALEKALREAGRNLYVIQEFRNAMRLEHPLYDKSGSVRETIGRLRLNPYFFIEGNRVVLAGALAIFCPPDKKVIHGMKDAALLPCRVEATPGASLESDR